MHIACIRHLASEICMYGLSLCPPRLSFAKAELIFFLSVPAVQEARARCRELPENVLLEGSKSHGAVQTRNAPASRREALYDAPDMLSGCLSSHNHPEPRGRCGPGRDHQYRDKAAAASPNGPYLFVPVPLIMMV